MDLSHISNKIEGLDLSISTHARIISFLKRRKNDIKITLTSSTNPSKRVFKIDFALSK